MRRMFRLFGVLVVCAIIVVSLLGIWVENHLYRPLPLQKAQTVVVKPGASYSGFLHSLAQQGLLGSESEARIRRIGARLYALFTGIDQHLFVGEYRLHPGDTLATLLEKIDRGQVVQHSITLVEGWTFKEWRRRLDALKNLEHDSKGLTGEQIMARLGMPDYKPEGWFAPNTYFYTRGASDLDVMRRALERQRHLLEVLWPQRDDNLPYDDPYQALIMASIVEKETAQPRERAMIAGVFVNRLRIGMRLQTDPTVIYGMGDRYHGNLQRADLRRPTPYNTYVITGLPPTPIAMPGKASIAAALHPCDTDALFFVARGDGSHVFSRTLAAHQRAVREYQLTRSDDYRSSPEPIDSSSNEPGKCEP